MCVFDFFVAWSGDGFGAVANFEAHFDDEPACDFVDDVAQAFAERVAPFRGLHADTGGRSCVVCDEPAPSRTAATCSPECATKLARLSAPLTAGETFGLLVSVRAVGSDNRGHIWEFRCECGALVTRAAADVRSKARTGRFVGCPCCSPLNANRHVATLGPAEILRAASRNHRAWAQRARKAA